MCRRLNAFSDALFAFLNLSSRLFVYVSPSKDYQLSQCYFMPGCLINFHAQSQGDDYILW